MWQSSRAELPAGKTGFDWFRGRNVVIVLSSGLGRDFTKKIHLKTFFLSQIFVKCYSNICFIDISLSWLHFMAILPGHNGKFEGRFYIDRKACLKRA